MKQLLGTDLKRFNRKTPKHDLDLILILDNLSYATNVAGIFRTADAAGVHKVYLCGITAKPPFGKDLRKASRSKEKYIEWEYAADVLSAIEQIKRQGYLVVGLEITDKSIELQDFSKTTSKQKLALVVGNEAHGISAKTLQKLDKAVYIPMYGKGGSLNVGTSLAIAIYTLILDNKS